MASSAELKVRVSADTKAAEVSLSSLNSSFAKIGQGATNLLSISTVASKAFGILSSATKDLTATYAVQEQAEARLQTTLKATGNQIGMSTSELYAMASAFQDVTTFGDETILGVQKVLIATKSLTKDGLKDAVGASLDLAAAMGTDAESAATQLAKALSNPAEGLNTLSRAGLKFTEEEKDRIKSLQESNKLSEAQAEILKKVEGAYGGIAENLAKTDTGKLTQISNVWGDIKESLGQGLLDNISPALDALYTQLTKISKWIKGAVEEEAILNQLERDPYFAFNDHDPASVAAAYKTLSERKAFASDSLKNTSLEGVDVGYNTTVKYLERIADWGLRNGYEFNEDGTFKLVKPVKNPVIHGGEADSVSDYSLTKSAMSYNAPKFEDYAYKNATYGKSDRDKALYDAFTGYKSGLASLETIATDDNATEILNKTNELEAEYSATVIEINKYYDALDAEKAKEEEIARIRQENIDLIAKEAEEAEAAVQKYLAEEEAKKQSEEARKKAIQDTIKYAEFSVTTSMDLFSSLADYQTSIWENQASALEKRLSKMKESWSSYYSDMKEKNDLERKSIELKYSTGQMSAEEYMETMQNLYETESEAKKKEEKEEQDLAKKADKLKERAFEVNKVNSIAQALINGAQAITNLWATNPWQVAAALTPVLATTNAVQVATIASQKYTGLATGGIVTKPTYTLLGEGGSHEAVLPLDKIDKYFGSRSETGGVINLTVNVEGNGGSDLSENVFYGIEKAQKTGLLPRWQFA